MNTRILGITSSLGLLVSCAYCCLQTTKKTDVGDQIVISYQALLRQGKWPGWKSKVAYLQNELEHYRNSGSVYYPFVLPVKNIPRYIALRAISFEIGVRDSFWASDIQAFARYPDSVRRNWSLNSQKLWLEATFDDPKRSTEETKAQTMAFRKLGFDVSALEAALILRKRLTLANTYSLAEELLKYAEAHPKDIMAARQAANILYVPSFLAVDHKQPLRNDLLDRTFALEQRTIANQNAFLHDNVKNIELFDILRKTVHR